MANENDQNTESTDAKPAPKKTTTRRKTTRKSTTPKKTTKAAVTTEDAAGEAAPKKKTTRRKSSTSTTRTKKATTKKADAETGDDATSEVAPKKKTTRRKSSTTTRTKKATVEAVEAAPADEAAPKKKTTRRPRRKKTEDTVEASASGDAAPKKTRTTTRRKSARASEPTVLDSVEDSGADASSVDADTAEAAPVKKKTTTRRKSSTTTRTKKASTKKADAEGEQTDSSDEAAPVKKKTTRRKSSTSTRAKKAATEEVAEAAPAEDAAPVKRKTTTRAKKKPAPKPAPTKKISALAANFLANFSSRGSSKPVAEAQEDIEIPVITIPDHPESDEPEELVAQGTAWLDGLFVAMGLGIKASGSFDEEAEQANFNLTGEDLSRILGPSNASPKILETVEKVLSVFFEQAGFRNVKVLVDCDGFRSKQAARIEQVGETLAALTEELGSELLIAGLNDFERRIIHRQIGEGRGLVTESTGYGSFRKLHLRPE